MNELEIANYVLEKEIEGIKAVATSLNHDFIRVIDILSAVKGRVIISGMGKSGHIARKIAATMSSTGTPAQFVHPAEASHGDLGMIAREDAVILLSNSGETIELRDIIEYCKRFSVPLIGIARRKSSVLIEAADIGIALPEVAEASPIGAPTTSTTMMLALGDAIAMALLNRKGFEVEDFQMLHPGGKLGSRFTKVEDLMNKGDELPLIAPNSHLKEAIIVMTSKRLGCVVVVDDQNKLLGLITDGDLRRHINDIMHDSYVEDVMTINPKTATPHMLVSQAIAIMNEKKITNLCVVDQKNIVVGIIHIHDCLKAGII